MTSASRLAPPAAATGVGSLPGGDVIESTRLVCGECPDLPYLPELPARGPGSDLIGRTAGLLAAIDPGFAVDTTTTGWRFSDAPGRAVRRAQSWLNQDLDAFEEQASLMRGSVKVSLCGPWTLAAGIELRTGERALHDRGACADLSAVMTELVTAHVGEVQRRLPNATVVVQIDEPSLSAVLTGAVSRQSGWGRLDPVEESVVIASLRKVVESIRATTARSVIHCCADQVPYDVISRTGVDGFSVEPSLVQDQDLDVLGNAFESGRSLILGVVPAIESPLSDVGASVRHVMGLSRRIGFAVDAFVEQVLLAPTCGLAGASPAYVRAVMTHLRGVSDALTQADDQDS